MAKRILGMGDVVSLIESAVKVQQEEIEQEQAERMMRANLNLNDFIEMNRQIRKMGGIAKLVSALPGGDKAMAAGQVDEGALDHMEVIINSMTKAEREKPDLLNGSRRARIAAGAGVTVSDVNQLIRKFNEAQKMMKKMMPAVEDMQGGKKGRKGKKGRRRRMGLPGMGGMSMARLEKAPGHDGGQIRDGSFLSSCCPRQSRRMAMRRRTCLGLRGRKRERHLPRACKRDHQQRIFEDDADFALYLKILARVKRESPFVLYAYCLMSNHVHLLLGEQDVSLSRVIQRIGVSYAYRFNQSTIEAGISFRIVSKASQ